MQKVEKENPLELFLLKNVMCTFSSIRMTYQFDNIRYGIA